MKTVSMSGSLRENVGKKDAKKLRREAKVPCVLYGGPQQVQFSMEERDFKHLIFTPEVKLVDLTIDGKTYKASMQDVQYHPVTDSILHVDFMEIVTGKPIIIGIPIKIKGTSPGILKGGKLIQKLRKLKVTGMVENLPDFIDIDISGLDIGDSLKVSNVKEESLQLLDNPNMMIVSVQSTSNQGC
ncbi:MAG: 50S ribosomal protein L25/general stress protein Ctc [Bacteroidetes bacterium]|nr:50S ribosomal protein L25/general stress protein Ctc [Bacteroidota bacterium]